MPVLEQAVQSNSDLQERLIRRAWEDEQFAELLKTNPRMAIAEETGIEIPGNVEIQVHKEDANTLHLVVPARPTENDETFDIYASGGYTACPVSCPQETHNCPINTEGGYDCGGYGPLG